MNTWEWRLLAFVVTFGGWTLLGLIVAYLFGSAAKLGGPDE